MEIRYNNYTIKAVLIEGQNYIRPIELSRLSGVSIQSISNKMVVKKYTLSEYIKGSPKNWLISLEGCIKILEMFRFPNDGLIAEIKKAMSEPKEGEARPVDAESLVDMELERIRVQKVKEELKQKDNQAKIDMILQKVKDIDLRLENLERPKQEDTGLRALFKECIKEVIKNELFGG